MPVPKTTAEYEAYERALALKKKVGHIPFNMTIIPESPKPPPAKPPKRIRQSSRQMNKLEAEFKAWAEQNYKYLGMNLKYEAITLKLANGVRLTPDFVSTSNNESDATTFFEVKGKHAWEDSMVKLKIAAKEWDCFVFHLCWKENGQWYMQEILP